MGSVLTDDTVSASASDLTRAVCVLNNMFLEQYPSSVVTVTSVNVDLMLDLLVLFLTPDLNSVEVTEPVCKEVQRGHFSPSFSPFICSSLGWFLKNMDLTSYYPGFTFPNG